MPPPDPAAVGLDALDAEVRRDLERLCFPPADWVATPGSKDGGPLHVLIVGAGMLGQVAAFALMRQGISDVRLVDRATDGREGPWLTYARMRTLRSPKHLAGPALGIPSLTFRAWYEAQYGEAGWDELGRIPRETWMTYLQWYRRVLALPVTSEIDVTGIEAAAGGSGFTVHLRSAEGEARLAARKVVLATGREGIARPRIPVAFAGLEPGVRFHSADEIPAEMLRDRRVAVVGLGASAFDNAAAALEAGARAVHLLGRADSMPRVNKGKAIGYGGFTEGFPALPLDDRHELLAHIARARIAPPRASVLRVANDPRFHLHLGFDVTDTPRSMGDGLGITATDGRVVEVDRVILGTGFRIDVSAAPELSTLAPFMTTWRTVAGDSPLASDSEFLDFPALGDAFEFIEGTPGACPALGDLHCFNYAAALTHGNVSGDIPAVSDGAERLARGIARDFFLADRRAHRSALERYDDPELLGDELTLDRWSPPVP